MKKLRYILPATLLLLSGCMKMQFDGPIPAYEEAIKVPITIPVQIPVDGLPTKAMADDPQIKNIVVAVFGGSGYFNEWVPVESATEMATYNYADYDGTEHDYVSYALKVKLTMSNSRLRLHIIANCPSDLLNNPPITGISNQDTEEIIMSKVRSKLGDTNIGGDNIEDGYWGKILLPFGVQVVTEITNGVEQPKLDANGDYIPTNVTKHQFERFNPAGIPLVRNFARIYLHNHATDWTIQKFCLAFAPAEGPIAPMLSSPYQEDQWGARVNVTFSPDEHETATATLVNTDNTSTENSRVPGHELKVPDSGADVLRPGGVVENFYEETFLVNYSNLPLEQPSDHTDWRLLGEAPYNYGGYSPADLAFGTYPANDNGMLDWSETTALYMYERAKPRTGQKATRIIIKAYKTSAGPSTAKYYPLDIVDADGNSMAILRNFTYDITLADIADGAGSDTIAEAAGKTSANVSADPKTQDLNEVSDGTARIAVSYIDATYIKAGQYDLMFRFEPLIDQGEHNEKVNLQVGYDDGNGFVPGAYSGNGSAFAASGAPAIVKNGDAPVLYVRSGNDYVVATAAQISDLSVAKWGKITYTTVGTAGNPFSGSYTQTIRVIGTKNDGTQIYRDVLINLAPLRYMKVECLDKYLPEETGVQERVRVYIPDDITRSMFPLQFIMEAKAKSLNPAFTENLPVNSGTSLSGSGETTYYFIKALTRDDYNTLPRTTAVLGGVSRDVVYFDCSFSTIKEENASEVYVYNDYFNLGSDEFYNYIQREFSSLMFSDRVAAGGNVEFSFVMDAGHSDDPAVFSSATDPKDAEACSDDYRVLPNPVTVIMTGLEPQLTAQNTFVDVRLERVSAGVYKYTPANENDFNPTLHLKASAGAEDYSIKLTSQALPNKNLYAEATRMKSDPCPHVDAISVNPGTATVLQGRGVELTATLTGDFTDDMFVNWTSSDESVATVTAINNRKCEVHGVAAGGPVTITATAGGKTATCTVTVVVPTVTSISITPEEATVRRGGNTTLTATKTGTYPNEVPTVWSSSDDNIATVDENGVVTGVAAGSVTITASSGGKEDTCEVTVVNTTTVTLSSPTVNNNNDDWRQRTWTSTPVQITFSSGRRRRAGYYNYTYYTQADDNSNMTITTTTNKRIVSITINYYHNANTVTVTGGSYSENTAKSVGTWTGSETSVQFNFGRDDSDTYLGISSIVVEYEN